MKKVVAKAIIVRPDKRILFLYRGDTHPSFPGHLDLPGGEVETGENWEEAVIREIKEETSLVAKAKEINKVFEKSYEHVAHVIYLIELNESSPQVSLGWEHSKYEWLTKDEVLKARIPKGIDEFFLDVLNYLKTH